MAKSKGKCNVKNENENGRIERSTLFSFIYSFSIFTIQFQVKQIYYYFCVCFSLFMDLILNKSSSSTLHVGTQELEEKIYNLYDIFQFFIIYLFSFLYTKGCF